MKHSDLKDRALKRKNVKTEYEALEPEFTILRELLQARQKAGLSQAEIAERMGTKAPAITRLESSLSSGKYADPLTIHPAISANATVLYKDALRYTGPVLALHYLKSERQPSLYPSTRPPGDHKVYRHQPPPQSVFS